MWWLFLFHPPCTVGKSKKIIFTSKSDPYTVDSWTTWGLGVRTFTEPKIPVQLLTSPKPNYSHNPSCSRVQPTGESQIVFFVQAGNLCLGICGSETAIVNVKILFSIWNWLNLWMWNLQMGKTDCIDWKKKSAYQWTCTFKLLLFKSQLYLKKIWHHW